VLRAGFLCAREHLFVFAAPKQHILAFTAPKVFGAAHAAAHGSVEAAEGWLAKLEQGAAARCPPTPVAQCAASAL
jgi:hypothetical protein